METIMNPIEKVMTTRTTEFKAALGVAVLVVLLLATGSSFASVWPIPVIVVVLWIIIRQVLQYRRRHHAG